MQPDLPQRETLKDHLVRLIEAEGPITVERYMSLALGDPRFGYYMTRDPLGRRGDFITAPEISQMFGEIIGLWLASEWQRMGAPDPVRLVELGPGRGSLMADCLRAMAVVPGMLEAAQVHLVETSPVLRAEQQSRLEATWHETLTEVPRGPMLLVANEFFDALPVRQMIKTHKGWAERCVGVTGGRLEFVAGEPVGDFSGKGAPGDIFETSPASGEIIAEVAGRLRRSCGAALIIDYGHTAPGPGDTLQAVAGHKYAEVLAQPGEADLTAHVDFAALGKSAAAAGATVHGPVTQGAFLTSLGIEERARKLKDSAEPDQSREIHAALERLTGRDAMGDLFRVMALTEADAPAPAGFEVAP